MFRVQQLARVVRLAPVKSVCIKRNFKNFGHKPTPTPIVTVLWHGFLTFFFIGTLIEWKRLKRIIFGQEEEEDFEELDEDALLGDNL